jgi:hypothetical protein
MKLQTLVATLAAFASLSVAGAATAGDSITARLQQPVAARTMVIAGGAVFVCEADTCLAATPTTRTFATGACKDLAKTVGAVASFGGERKQFDADKLGACNAAAAAATELARR